MRQTPQRVAVLGLALLVAAFCSCFDLSGTKCGGASGACGSGYYCTAAGTCQKGTAPDAAVAPPDSGSAPGLDAAVAPCDGSACDLDSPCGAPLDCKSRACLFGQCKAPLFLDDFEGESTDGGLFARWDIHDDCTICCGTLCQGVTGQIVEADAIEGSHSALFGLNDDCTDFPYWDYEEKGISPAQAKLAVGMYVRWNGGTFETYHQSARFFGLSPAPQFGGGVIGGLMVGIVNSGASANWALFSVASATSEEKRTLSNAVVDQQWHYVELRLAQAAYSLFLDGAQIASDTGTFTEPAAYVLIGEPHGCMSYSFSIDLVAASAGP